MSKFYDALEVLRTELQLIAGNDLRVDDQAVADSSLSEKIFVQKEMLSAELRGAVRDYDNLATDVDVQNYSRGVLQAIYNITHYASMNILRAAWNKNSIKQSFNYLDGIWAPKIINETTYKVGKALQVFLNTVLHEDVAAEFKVGKDIVASAQTALKNIKNSLVQRIQIYEMHQPKALEDTRKWMRFHLERLEQSNAFKTQFQEQQQQMQKTFADTQSLIASPLAEDSQTYVNQLAQLEESFSLFEHMIPQVKQQLDTWNTENESTADIPKSRTISAYILLSLNNSQEAPDEIFQSWFELYNADQLDLFDYKILSDLQSEYTDFENLIQNSQQEIHSSFTKQKQKLEEQVADAQSLAEFVEQLNNYLDAEQVIADTALVQYQDKTMGPILENIDAYSQLIEQIKEYKQRVQDQRERLLIQENEFNVQFAIPAVKAVENQEQFALKKQQAQAQLQQKIVDNQKQLTVATAVIESVRQALHQAQDAIFSASSQGRIEALTTIQQRIDTISQHMQEQSKPQYDRLAQELTSYQNETVLPESEKVYEQFNSDIDTFTLDIKAISDSLEQSQARLEQIESQKSSRREFLEQARTDLITFSDLLSQHNKFYFPVDKISQEQLLKYLECNDQRKIDAIKTIYQAAANGTSWMGINRDNWTHYYQYYYDYDTEVEFSYDWEFISEYIDSKLDLIDTELAMNDSDFDVPGGEHTAYLLPANLGYLNQVYSLVQQEVEQLEHDRQLLDGRKQQLEASRQQALEVWDTPLSDLSNKLAQANAVYQLDKLALNLAHTVKASYQLEFKLTDIERAQNELEASIQRLESISLADAITYYDSIKETIVHANANLMIKDKEHDELGLDLQERIRQNLLEAIQAYDHIKQLIELEELDVPEYQQTLIQLAQDIEELQLKQERLVQSIGHLKEVTQTQVQYIDEKKQQILAYQELRNLQLEIENTYPQLINSESLENQDKKTRDTLITNLEVFIEKRIRILEEFKPQNNDEITLLYNQIGKMAYQLTTHFTQMRLMQMEEEYPILIERFKGIKTIGQRAVLLKDVALMHARDNKFLRAIENPVGDLISEKLTAVKGLLVRLNFLNNELQLNDKYPEESDEEILQREYEIRLRIISAKYFGTVDVAQGIFPDYLYERSITYWFYDLFTNAAAFVFGYFGYQSDNHNRQEYIERTLKGALQNYMDADNRNKRTEYEQLVSIIDDGQRLFRPRVAKGEKHHDLSLCNKLELLREDVASVHEVLDHQELASLYP